MQPSGLDSNHVVGVGDLECAVRRTQNAGDIQAVTEGTGLETYQHALKELRSRGCPTWEDKVNEAKSKPYNNHLSFFLFGVDAGPDEKGMDKRVLKAAKDVPTVLVMISFCLFHRCHLVVKAVLSLMDAHTWPDCAEPYKPIGRAYFPCSQPLYMFGGALAQLPRCAPRRMKCECQQLFEKASTRCLANA